MYITLALRRSSTYTESTMIIELIMYGISSNKYILFDSKVGG